MADTVKTSNYFPIPIFLKRLSPPIMTASWICLCLSGLTSCNIENNEMSSQLKPPGNVLAVKNKAEAWFCRSEVPNDQEVRLLAEVVNEKQSVWREAVDELRKRMHESNVKSLKVLDYATTEQLGNDRKHTNEWNDAIKLVKGEGLLPIVVMLGSADSAVPDNADIDESSSEGYLVVIALVSASHEKVKILTFFTPPLK
jgi:hypothetical protein